MRYCTSQQKEVTDLSQSNDAVWNEETREAERQRYGLPEEKKPKAYPHNPVFENTFAPPHCLNKWLTAAGIFQGLKVGAFKWEKLPKEVQDGVEKYLESKQFKETLV